jgi:hypothetical protein
MQYWREMSTSRDLTYITKSPRTTEPIHTGSAVFFISISPIHIHIQIHLDRRAYEGLMSQSDGSLGSPHELTVNIHIITIKVMCMFTRHSFTNEKVLTGPL